MLITAPAEPHQQMPTLPDARGLRVAIISDAAPERNGVGAYYRDLADHLRSAGARVELLAPLCRRGSWHGGLALPLPGDPTQKLILPSTSLLSARLKRLQPQVVVVPTPGPFGLLGLYLAKRMGVRLVVGFHTHFDRLTQLFPNWRWRARVFQAYLSASHRLLFAHSEVVLANSAEMIASAKEIGASRVDLMGTPIPRRFLEKPLAPSSRHLQRVLFAGRLAPEKNLDVIVEAARRLPEIEFQIAGDGPLRGWLLDEARRAPNLRHIGWVKRERVLALIDGADALILPSKVESFGTIALEAMARARPVVVSSACGILSWDLLSRGLFPIRHGEHLAETLARLRDLDPALRDRKTFIARKAAIEMNRRNLHHWLAVLRGPEG